VSRDLIDVRADNKEWGGGGGRRRQRGGGACFTRLESAARSLVVPWLYFSLAPCREGLEIRTRPHAARSW